MIFVVVVVVVVVVVAIFKVYIIENMNGLIKVHLRLLTGKKNIT